MFNKIQDLNKWQVMLLFILVSVLIRLPFFFRDYIDHDESTFILMGQALVDGHLPYTQYWDLKPPLVFYAFAGVISIFGKSFIAIRLIGSIVVGLTAWYTYRLSALHFDKIGSFFAGLLSIYLLSLFGAMQGVMSEHLAALPLLMGVYYLSKNHIENSAVLLLSGFLFGLSIMFRLNLAYAIFFVYTYVLFYNGLNIKGVTKAFFLTVGSFIAFGICILPYLLSDNLIILKTSVLDASLAYSNVSFDKMLKTLPLVIAFILLSGLSIRFLKSCKRFSSFMLIVVMLIGQAFMFFKSGKINGHYLIQAFPFLAILITGFISKISLSPKLKKAVPILLVMLFVLLPIESYVEAANVVKCKKETGSLYNGEGNTIPRYLIANYGIKTTQSIVFFNEHIGYWVLNTMPPCAIATHPSNIFRETAYPYVEKSRENSVQELIYIFNENQPNFVVFDERRIPMPRNSEEYAYFQNQLKSNYELEKIFGDKQNVKLYKRKGLQ